MGKFTARALADIRTITRTNNEQHSADLCTMIFTFIKERSGSSCDTLAKEIMIEDTWDNRLVKLCGVVEKGVNRGEWPPYPVTRGE